jgi:small-conductance mechanosensitive channel
MRYFNLLLGCFFLLITSWASAQRPDSPVSSNLAGIIPSIAPTIWTKAKLIEQLSLIEIEEKRQTERIKVLVDSLRQKHTGYPVVGPEGDTLLTIWQKSGELSAQQRAEHITQMLEALKADELLKPDSIRVDTWIATTDVMYQDKIIASFTEPDMMWYTESRPELANGFRTKLVASLTQVQEKASWMTFFIRASLVILVLTVLYFLLLFIGKLYQKSLGLIDTNKDKFLRDLTYKSYTFLSKEQELDIILTINKGIRWLAVIITVYLALPLLFSIFPFTQGWADKLFTFIWDPFKGVLLSVIDYIPNVFRIFVIYYVMSYFIKLVEFVFNEIQEEKLMFSGFYADWAIPTYNIVKFVLYAFMFVLIFPYLPGSDSQIFQGVTVFLGVLFSLGSSTAISNVIAGLVITYMRPFKVGDHIKIQDAEGEVVEKTMLITRLKTATNEIVTIPNSSILALNTTNFSSATEGTGLIVYTTIKVGYNISGQKVHEALMEAAQKVPFVVADPKPFVIQSGIQDGTVTYQINTYCKQADKIGIVHSELIQSIQRVFAEKQIPLPISEKQGDLLFHH